MAQAKPRRAPDWRQGPSLFWPVVLMTVGVLWLLVNNGRAEPENIYRLLVFWPALLVAAGLAAILRPASWVLSGLVWLALGAVMVWAVLYPPASLPGYAAPHYTRQQLAEPLGAVEKAVINLDLSFSPTTLQALAQQDDNLFSAEIPSVGRLNYDVSGSGAQKTIRLSEEIGSIGFNLPAVVYESRAQPWRMGLSTRVPLNININAGVGDADVDLSALELTALKINGSLGAFKLQLPEDSAAYDFSLEVSTGNVSVEVLSGATFDLDLRGGTGSVELSLPADSGVQVTVRKDGIGSLNLPAGYRKVRQRVGQNSPDEDEGVWENEAFKNDKTPIRIQMDINIGNITIR